MAKSKTWKRNRDESRRINQSGDTVGLTEIDLLIKGTAWSRGWADRINGAQIGIVYLLRRGVDDVAVAQWPVYAGWGENGSQVPRSILADIRSLLESPPPPKKYITLKRATVDDVEEYLRIGSLVASRLDLVTTDREEALQDIATTSVYMIQIEERSVGIITYLMRSADHAYVDEVAVEPAYQGQGIGGWALKRILHELRDIPLIELHTHPENPAQRLYRRHGFRETGVVVENWYGSGEPRMQMIFKRT